MLHKIKGMRFRKQTKWQDNFMDDSSETDKPIRKHERKSMNKKNSVVHYNGTQDAIKSG